MHKFANPARFMRLSNIILPWTAAITVVLFGLGLYYSLVLAPEDYQMGNTYRIMFIHVPAAYMAQFGYAAIAVSSAVGFIWKHPLADQAARATAPMGAAFTALALLTGSLWGKPMWGTYWIWDARLTSMLILLFIYLGYIAVWQTIEDQARAAKIAAIVAMVGLINVIIIKFSVDWWNTLHQPATLMRMDGPTIGGDMLAALLLMIAAFNMFFITILLWRIQSLILRRRIRSLRMQIGGGQG
ncbi:MAG: heme transporter HemC [Alphaproteobacteria bacterium]|nr:MAG: heme transporter HemC [Alphaproteobacteria bacterium]